ncbi:WD40 repeat-like protein, partial [Rhizoctonia solani]
MSSPPGTPKQRKGLRLGKLLKAPFVRSRSRSPSQSRPPSTSNEGTGLAGPSNVYTGASQAGVDEAARANVPPSANTPEGPFVALTTPIIAEPTESGTRVMQPTAINPTPSPQPTNNTTDTASPIKTAMNSGPKDRSTVWDGLRGALRAFKDTSSIFPPLFSAVESLIECIDELETAAQNRGDLEEIAMELTALGKSLNDGLNGPSPAITSDSVASLAMASSSIKTQITEVRERLDRTKRGGIRDARAEEEELVRHYRRIEAYFRQIQTNITMSTWSIANEHLVNTRLEGLNPVKQATYDSNLSTEINRRSCTEGTRVGVLDDLDNWVYNPTSRSVYWMNGMAGTGKTTIASTFCDRVEKRKLLAASFFCTRSSSECRNVSRIIPTIAYQLARYSIPYRSALYKILGQNPDIGSKNVLKQFEHLLKEPLQQVKGAMPEHLVVVVDALDECDDHSAAVVVLDMLFRHATDVPLKFLITSRPEPEIYSKMSLNAQLREVIHLHEIEKSLVQEDIALYLKTELKSMSLSSTDIEQLVVRSGTLFIYAATLVRYILPGKQTTNPHKRLRSVLSMTPESTKKHAQIDALYTAVLQSALSEDELEADEAEDIRVVLRTVLFAQEPISVGTIAELANIDDPQRVVYALHPLRSVLHQSEQTGLVSTLHASFLDFMFSNQRSGAYFCDVVEHSQLLARRCFSVMKEQLKFNICDLESSFVSDTQVHNMSARVQKSIPSTLAYACRYWASHLTLAPKSDVLFATLEDFLSHRLLFWIEVLNLRRETALGIEGLLKGQQWLIHVKCTLSELLLLVEDARNLLSSFSASPASKSTPHIYISSLSFCPRSSSIYKHYWKRTQNLIELKGSLMERREVAPLATWNVGSSAFSAAYSPDGAQIVVGCGDGSVRILGSYGDSVLIGPLEGHTQAVFSVAFSHDGSAVASASYDHTIRIWNAYNGALIAGPLQGHTDQVFSVDFSPDDTRLVTCSYDRTIRIWDTRTGAPVRGPLEGHAGPVCCVRFSPNGSLIASCSRDGTVRLWNVRDGTATTPPLVGHTDWVLCVSFVPDGSKLVSAGQVDTIRVWQIPDGSHTGTSFEAVPEFVYSVATSPDGTQIAAASSDGTVRVWNINDGNLIAGPFRGHTDWVRSVAYSPDGTRLVSTSHDNTVRVWNVRNGLLAPASSVPPDALTDIKSLSFTLDNSHLISIYADKSIRIWDLGYTYASSAVASDQAQFPDFPISNNSLSELYTAGASETGKVQILSTADGSVVSGPFEIDYDSLFSLSFSSDNAIVVMGCKNGLIHAWDLGTGEPIAGPFVGHTWPVTALTQSHDGSMLASYSEIDKAIRIWNMPIATSDPQSQPNFSLGFMSSPGDVAAHDEWTIAADGWMVDNDGRLLIWLPSDVAAQWKSPYASLVITRFGKVKDGVDQKLCGQDDELASRLNDNMMISPDLHHKPKPLLALLDGIDECSNADNDLQRAPHVLTCYKRSTWVREYSARRSPAQNMSSANNKPKSTRKRIGGWFRKRLGESSSRPLSTSSPGPLSTSHASLTSGSTDGGQSSTPDIQNIITSTDRLSHAVLSNSLPAPSVLNAVAVPHKSPSSQISTLIPELAIEQSHGHDELPPTRTTTELVGDNKAWTSLLASLKKLKGMARLIPSVADAAGVLLDCFDTIEAAAKSQQDYEDLATELAALSDTLTQQIEGMGSEAVSKCASGVAQYVRVPNTQTMSDRDISAIERQAEEIKKKRGRGKERRLQQASSDEEDVMRHYRRIESLFRQLQANLSMNTWSVANDLMVNTRLEGLGPEKQAAYDSALSETIGRRTCTEGTRTKVLSDLVEWAHDKNAPAIYWMNGMAGTGKTTIAYSFAEWLKQHELLAGSFFCTRTSAACRDVAKIVPTVVYQLARYSATFQSILYDILSAEPDASTKNVTKQFESLLKEALEKTRGKGKGDAFDNLVIVIDALDECEDPRGSAGAWDLR